MTRTGASQKANPEKEPIAIIGIGCRYPGGVKDPQTFWQLLANGVDAITDIPADRVDVAPLYDPNTGAPGKIATSQGGFLDKLDQFDASFFGVSPREAEYMDPQQRLLLETSWEAFEDAGQLPETLKESQTGVFVGMWTTDYTEKMYKDVEDINLYVTTGGGRYAASGRLSYFFGLQGPSMTVDTACSSSLVTVHLACQSLREGESNLALAGGVNLILEPAVSIGYSRSKMLSPDGRCKFGDVRANGYVRSEGAGMIVLKRLSDAIADNDQIYAVIRGSAVNNDGRSSELLVAPGVGSQIKMLHEAYRNAGVDPCQVGYVEAHGTGTPVGDPVELEALGAVLSENRDASRACRIGSIKTNIGHTEAASGVASLIKTALILKHKAIPPSLHFQNPNPKIPWTDLKLEMQTELTSWPYANEPAFAAVNSFGITGTNAHVVLEAAPQQETEEPAAPVETYLLPLSAQTPEALKSLAETYLTYLNSDDAVSLYDICYTASCRRGHHAERLAVIGKSPSDLAEQLSIYLEQQSNKVQNKIDGQSKIAFVFPGQGGQWTGMGRELLQQNTVFHETLTQCDETIQRWAGWSLLEQLSLDEASPAYRLNEISVIQPALFAMEVALAAVWRSWGIEPDAVIGHSMGEVAAAFIAGALSLDDATRVICHRSQLMQRTSGKGAMAVIGLPFTETEKLLIGYEDKLSIAVQNSPKSTVVSGDPDALQDVMQKLQAQEIFNRLIKVDVASHSPQMDPIRPELVESLHEIQPQPTTIPFYSTVTQDIAAGQSLDASYWGRNLRQPVRFGDTTQRLLEDEHVIFIEMNPHPILLASIEETRSSIEKAAYGIASTRRDQPELASLLRELGSLYSLGYDIDWSKLYPNGGQVITLPTYPWQRERFWFEATVSAKQARPGAHPFLGQYLHAATGEHIWETTLGAKQFQYMNDHQVRGSAVFPAAGYVEMMLAAAAETYGSKPYSLNKVTFEEALFLSGEKEQVLQLVMTAETADAAEFQIYSRAAQNESADSWTLHASGRVEVGETASHENIDVQTLLSHKEFETSAQDFYRAAAGRRLEYGPNFQSIHNLVQSQDGVLAKIKLPESLVSSASKYQLHPVVLDACLQTLVSALPESNQDTYLPVTLQQIQMHAKPNAGKEMWCHVPVANEQSTGDLFLFNEDGQLVMSARELVLQRIETKQDMQDLFYEVQWQEAPLPALQKVEPLHWLVFADQAGFGKALAEHLRLESQSCTWVFQGDSHRRIADNHYELDPYKPVDFQQLLKDIPTVQGVVYLWGLDASTPASETHTFGALHLVQALGQYESASPRLWLVTRGTQTISQHTQPEPVSVLQASLWGMGAVIANEFPNLHSSRVDLSPNQTDREIELFVQILQAGGDEDQIALRNGQRYAARLKRSQFSAESEAQQLIRQKIDRDQPFQVKIMTPGILDGLSIQPGLKKPLKPGHIEIAVKATGLNFMNVMSAMGIYPGYPNGVGPLGIECAGIVTNVGEGVTDLQPGDEVVGIAFDSLASHAVTDARLVVKKPTSLSFEEAASIPIAYVTAYYALLDLGRMQSGERVLIHSATGGVGLAAIQLAKHVGAEVFATAGSQEKHAYLRQLGLTHIMDSRSLAFADDIMKVTNGEGVDLVLNSLAGNAISKGLEVLKPYGRFLEIGKRDIYGNSKVGLLPFQKNLSYFAIDLDKMSRERPEVMGKILREVFALMEAGEISPLPVQAFPVSKVSEAFRTMAQAKHMGKIAITLEDPQAVFERPAAEVPIHADGTYLITGGLGDLGLTFARWLTERGARHLVLMGRSKPSPEAQKRIDDLIDSGVQVVTAQADVTDLQQLENVFSEIKHTLPALKGVIHAAGLLADATILQMDSQRFKAAYDPKALGAWNLHTLTANQPLDFFILFSSVAATLGMPGQVNYAAGNAFLDALARFRHAQNLPALSINWGPWSEIGLASTQENRGNRLAQQGLRSISPAQGLESMSVLMTQKLPQVSVVDLDTNQWCQAQPAAAQSSLFKELRVQAPAPAKEEKLPGKNIRMELLGVEAGRQRRSLFDTLLREHIAQVLHLPASRIPSDKPLKSLGLDSLMSIELRNRLEDALGVSLSASLIWNYPTVNALAPFLAEKLGVPLDESVLGSAAKEDSEAEASPTASALDELDKDELEALLAEELSAIDDTLKGSGFDTEDRR